MVLVAGLSLLLGSLVFLAGGTPEAGASVGSRLVEAAPFSATGATNGAISSGQPFGTIHSHGLVSSHAIGAGSGFLAVFQEASASALTVTVNGVSPSTSLSFGAFTYGPVAAGTYTITASQGASTVATGTVVVGAGQDVTALVYLGAGGAPMIAGFANDRSSVPLGDSRIVFRNTGDVGPVDIYMNGIKVASALRNDFTASSVAVIVPAGQVTIQSVPAGEPEGDFLVSQTGGLIAGDLLNVFVVGSSRVSPSTFGFLTNANPLGLGYRLYASDGGVFDFGDAGYYGSTGAMKLNKPVVGAMSTSNGFGYWLVASDGGIFTFGDAGFYGSTGKIKLNKPIVGMATTPDDGGYWLAATDGGVFSFGDAKFYGSTGNIALNRPIVGMASTADGKGYWLVASDGGVFSFGDATFYGSTGALTLNKPIVAIVPTVDGNGYWLIASDGGVFSFGDATFYGSTGALTLNKPIVAAISTPDSLGYWLVASDGGIFSFGDAQFFGSTGSLHLNKPIVTASAPGAPLPT